MWCVGVLAYVVAVFQRTSLGVAGPETIDRFQATPALLSGLVVIQILVYASMQIPAGLLLDRYGTRLLVTVGAILMAAGQIALALTFSLPLAVAARLIVGLGDSLTLIAVLRLVAHWFPPHRSAILSQMTGMIGQFGQVISAVPFAIFLRYDGWTNTFVAAAAVSMLTAALAAALITDTPIEKSVARSLERRSIRDRMVETIGNPGTQMGFFVHMGTMFSLTTFVLLWGVPYFTRAQMVSPSMMSVMLTTSVGVSILGGVILGVVSARKPQWRHKVALAIIGANMAAWTSILLSDSPSSIWHLFILILVMSIGAPGSLIGFDLARTTNPSEQLGSAQGIVNTGGYFATLVAVLGIGFALSMYGEYDLDSFNAAWTVQYCVWFVAIIGILVCNRHRSGGKIADAPAGSLT